MAFSEKTKELMENQEFLDKLESLETPEEIQKTLEENGIDLEKEFTGESEEEEELSEESLEDVAGGKLSYKQVERAVITGFKTVSGGPLAILRFGGSCTVLLKAYYDIKVYGNVFRTYNQSQIEAAARRVGCL